MKIKKWLPLLTLACASVLSLPLTANAEDYTTPYTTPPNTSCDSTGCTITYYVVRRWKDGNGDWQADMVLVTIRTQRVQAN